MVGAGPSGTDGVAIWGIRGDKPVLYGLWGRTAELEPTLMLDQACPGRSREMTYERQQAEIVGYDLPTRANLSS
jgi:hypothetical protein